MNPGKFDADGTADKEGAGVQLPTTGWQYGHADAPAA
jgi:hypothetical protein